MTTLEDNPDGNSKLEEVTEQITEEDILLIINCLASSRSSG